MERKFKMIGIIYLIVCAWLVASLMTGYLAKEMKRNYYV